MIKHTGARADYGRLWAERLRADQHNFYSQANITTLRKQVKIYQKFYPELLQEIQAAADELKMSVELLLYEEIGAVVDQQRAKANRHQHGCTIFAIHENGQTFVGRNYDWLPPAREFFEIYDLDITGANRYFAFSDEGVYKNHTGKSSRKPYFEDAINEYGLYIGLTYAYIDKWSYGIKPCHMIRYVAEKCRTTREALAAFRKIPNCVPKNYLIADAAGDIAVVEHAATDYDVIRPGDSGVIVKTNHSLSPKLKRYDRVLKDDPATTSFVCQAEAAYLIAEQMPGFQFTDIWRILRESHYVYNDETLWSLALELSSGRFNIYSDTAMGQKQQKFGFEA